MKLVEFVTQSGGRLAVNPVYVSAVWEDLNYPGRTDIHFPATQGSHIDGTAMAYYTVRGTYDEVMAKLEDAIGGAK